MLKSLWRIYHEFTTTVNWQAELKVEPSIGDEAAVVRASEMSPKKKIRCVSTKNGDEKPETCKNLGLSYFSSIDER